MSKKIKTILIVDSSINGVISRAEGSDEGPWNSPEDNQQYRSKVSEIGVCIMGNTSFKVIGGKNYDGVKHYVMTRDQVLLANEQSNNNVVYTDKDYSDLIDEIADEGYETVAILGGQHIYSDMIKEDLVDEIIITIEPVILKPGVTLFNESIVESRWSLVSSKQLNDSGTLLLHYVR